MNDAVRAGPGALPTLTRASRGSAAQCSGSIGGDGVAGCVLAETPASLRAANPPPWDGAGPTEPYCHQEGCQPKFDILQHGNTGGKEKRIAIKKNVNPRLTFFPMATRRKEDENQAAAAWEIGWQGVRPPKHRRASGQDMAGHSPPATHGTRRTSRTHCHGGRYPREQ